MAVKQIAFFENMDSASYHLLKELLDKSTKIYAFGIAVEFGKQPEVQEWIETGKIIDANTIVFDYGLYAQAAFEAYKRLDAVFDEFFGKSRSIRAIEKLLDAPEIKDMYKYALLQELARANETYLKINKIMGKENADNAIFFASGNIACYANKSAVLDRNVSIVENRGIGNAVRSLLVRAKMIALLAVPFYILFKKIGGIARNIQRKEYKVAIMEDYPENLFKMNYFGNNVFLDNNELPAKDVLFITKLENDKKRLQSKKNLNAASIYDGRVQISLDFIWNKFILRLIPAWLKAMAYGLFDKPLVINVNRSVLFNYTAWNIFCCNYKIGNYVKRLLPDNQAKLCILSQDGIRTWFVFPDNTSHDYHLDWEHEKENCTLFSFMHFDNAAIHGTIQERYFKKHRNFIGRYHKLGVMFSQTARDVQEGRLSSPIFDLIKNKKMPKTIIGVFDTTFVDYGPVKIADGVRFAKDILRLLDEMPEVGILFKAAKEYEATPAELKPIYDQLKTHERCLFFYRYSKEGISAPEIIATSDLVLSAAYTSTVAEALCARKKGMYYDCGGRDLGPEFYFNGFPHLVAHNYDELRKTVKYWLYEINDREFDVFLNKYVKNEIDPYLDGKGFSRLRRLLKSSKDLNEVQAD